MEDGEGSESTKTALCEECKISASKYKCPGCNLRTCSLPCVKAHKHRTGCSGKKNYTSFVPLSQFDDNLLLNDYNLLEETKRVAESARRIRSKLCIGGYHPYFKLPYALRPLHAAAGTRRTKLLFLPAGMTKREVNRTRFHPRKKFITWTIEWRFQSTDVVLLDHGVHEDTSLCSVIANHLKPGPWNHTLRNFCEEPLDCLKLFIRKSAKGPKLLFKELDIKAGIRQQLADTVILEYPVIHVFLPSEHIDFELLENQPVNDRLDKRFSGITDKEIHKSVTFKEEQIEDDSSSEPQIFDLMKHVTSTSMHQIPHLNKSEKEFNDSIKPESIRVGPGNGVHSSSQTIDTGDFQYTEFDFDQGLIDAYSDLIADINPDDFLNLECEFAKKSVKEDGRGLLDFVAEVEEGEIVD